jgi:hypothetical protein
VAAIVGIRGLLPLEARLCIGVSGVSRKSLDATRWGCLTPFPEGLTPMRELNENPPCEGETGVAFLVVG